MMAQIGFLLEHRHALARILPGDLIGCGQTDNSSADHCNVDFCHHSPMFLDIYKVNRPPGGGTLPLQPIARRLSIVAIARAIRHDTGAGR
jgi:hypothetical protein